MGGSNNHAMIFDYLDLDVSDKNILAEKCYRYKPKDKDKDKKTDWPKCKYNDNQALERLIREIYRILEGGKTLKSDTISNRFDILDL